MGLLLKKLLNMPDLAKERFTPILNLRKSSFWPYWNNNEFTSE